MGGLAGWWVGWWAGWLVGWCIGGRVVGGRGGGGRAGWLVGGLVVGGLVVGGLYDAIVSEGVAGGIVCRFCIGVYIMFVHAHESSLYPFARRRSRDRIQVAADKTVQTLVGISVTHFEQVMATAFFFIFVAGHGFEIMQH